MTIQRADVTKVPLPPGVKAGAVVGRGGQNVKWIHIQSGGAHITVNDTGVVIRAKDHHVRSRALQLVRRQLENAARLACQADPMPTRSDYVLLESAYGLDPRVCFSLRTDEAATVTGHKDRLFQLVACPGAASPSGLSAQVAAVAARSPPSSCQDPGLSSRAGSPAKRDQDRESDQDSDSDRAGGRRSDWGGGDSSGGGAVRYLAARAATGDDATAAAASPGYSPRLWGVGTDVGAAAAAAAASRLGAQLQPAGMALAEAARVAASRTARVDGLRLRFKLGKALFRNLGPRMCRASFTCSELEDLGSGRGGAQCAFSGYVPPCAVPRVTSWLTQRLGFSLVGVKTSATLHVINQELNSHYAVGLDMGQSGDDSSAVLRKVRCGGPRCHSVVLLGGPGDLDLRVKMAAQAGLQHAAAAAGDDADAQWAAKRIAAAVRSEGFAGFVRSKRGLPRNWHLDYARRKTKHVYEGVVQTADGDVHRVRLIVSQILDCGGVHLEISGCLPDVNTQLQHMLSAAQSEQQHQPAPGDNRCCSTPSSAVQVASGSWLHRGSGGGASVGRRGSSGGGAASVGRQVSPAATQLGLDGSWGTKSLAALAEFTALLNAEARVEELPGGEVAP